MVHTTRVLRLSALAVVLALAWFAQYIFVHGTLQNLYPAWMTDRFALLQRSTFWLADDLYTLGLWLLGGCALIFGLLVPAWDEHPPVEPKVQGDLPPAAPQVAGTSNSSTSGVDTPAARLTGQGRFWLWLAALLGATALLVGWGWTTLPVRIDPQAAAAGLQAQALPAGAATSWLAPGATGAPQIAYFPSAVGGLLLGSPLAGAHLVGLLAALLTVLATCWLALELFWASPQRLPLALLAGGFTAGGVVMLHFGRLAPFLPATAAGTLAAAALLTAHRTGRLPLFAAGGVLAALAIWFDRTGLIFVPLLLLWWLGLRLQGPFSWRLFVLWLAGLLIFAAPLVLFWFANPSAWGAYWQGGPGQVTVAGDWWVNLRASAATLFWLPDAGSVFGYNGSFVLSFIAPLFVLGTGALLLNLDHLPGWCLLTWLFLVLLFSSVAGSVAPYWPLLLPLLPVVGMTVVFALDRMAALWTETSHEVGSSAAASLAGGLLFAVVVMSWIGYYEFAAVAGDAPSYTGRALGDLPGGVVALLVSSSPEPPVRLDDPVVQFAAGVRANQAISVDVNGLPASLPPGSRLLIQGSDPAALAAVRARYPNATLEITRDLRANPRLYVVTLP